MISLTTDFGRKDFSVGIVKATILTELPNAKIVDISHDISPFDLGETAYVIRNSYHHFPKESIHIIGVDAAVTPLKRAICVRIDEHYFIASDNGVLSLIGMDFKPEQIVELQIPTKENSNTILDVFIPTACHLARGGKLNVVGQKRKEMKQLQSLQPVIKENNTISGTVIYIDRFGNVITNISEKLFNDLGKKRDYTVQVRNHTFSEIFKDYTQVVTDFEKEENDYGKGMVLFNQSGFLEVAIYKSNPETVGSASTLFGLKKGDIINVMFS